MLPRPRPGSSGEAGLGNHGEGRPHPQIIPPRVDLHSHGRPR